MLQQRCSFASSAPILLETAPAWGCHPYKYTWKFTVITVQLSWHPELTLNCSSPFWAMYVARNYYMMVSSLTCKCCYPTHALNNIQCLYEDLICSHLSLKSLPLKWLQECFKVRLLLSSFSEFLSAWTFSWATSTAGNQELYVGKPPLPLSKFFQWVRAAVWL